MRKRNEERRWKSVNEEIRRKRTNEEMEWKGRKDRGLDIS